MMKPHTPAPISFAEFYATYALAHRHPLNRALHLLAKILLLGVGLAALVRGPIWLLLLVPIVAVAPCWLGHFLFEQNRPTSWTRPSESLLGWLRLRWRGERAATTSAARPYFSFAADLVLCASMFGIQLVAGEPTPPRSDAT